MSNNKLSFIWSISFKQTAYLDSLNLNKISRTWGSNSRKDLNALLWITFACSSRLSYVAKAHKLPNIATLLGVIISEKLKFSNDEFRKYFAADLYRLELSSSGEHDEEEEEDDMASAVLPNTFLNFLSSNWLLNIFEYPCSNESMNKN